MKIFDRNKVPFVFKNIDDYKKLEVLSFKRDRKITVKVDHPGSYTVIEEGFMHDQMHLSDKKELLKIIKKSVAKEFPNSHKLYISGVKKTGV